MSAPDLLGAVGMHLSASSALDGDVAVFYCAAARVSYAQAKERLAELERLLIARESALCLPKAVAK
jgi:hypothetical protein